MFCTWGFGFGFLVSLFGSESLLVTLCKSLSWIEKVAILFLGYADFYSTFFGFVLLYNVNIVKILRKV